MTESKSEQFSTDFNAVMLLESDVNDRTSLSKQMQASDYKVIAVSTWEQALTWLKKVEPGLVLCDFHLCCEDGHSAIERLAENWPDTAIIAVSDQLSARNAIDAMRYGAVDYLNKPVDQQTLNLAVTRALERSRLLTENRLYREQLEQANSRLKKHLSELEIDQRAGRSVQMSMLPPSPLTLGQYQLMHEIVPSLFLSGDFVDYFKVSENYFAFYVADVSGHGAGSAFVTVLLKNFSRRFRREHKQAMLTDPAQVLTWLNQELMEYDLGRHVSLCFGIVDTAAGVLHYANAGHFPNPMIASSDGVFVLEMPGHPLGLFKDVEYQSDRLDLPESFVLMIFTDGVLEVSPQNTLAAKEAGLVDAARKLPRDISEVWRSLNLEYIGRESVDSGLPDDICCLLISR